MSITGAVMVTMVKGFLDYEQEYKVGEVEPTAVKKVEESFIKMDDWEVRENANVNKSYGAFVGFLLDKILKSPEVLAAYMPERPVREHFNGYVHIHKLPHSLWIPYCAGWSISQILKKGMVTPTVQSSPAKHLDTAVSHLINFFFLAAQEWTGAQAVTAFDLYMAPFVKVDGLKPREVKQALQRMVFELNYPSRLGYQSPFTNITVILDTVKDFLDGDAIVGGRPAGKLEDYLNEALLINEKLFELYLEGDAIGQPFTFPIVTLMLTKNFDWNGTRWGRLTDLIFEVLSRRGSFYLLNGYATDVSGLYAMCCRLTIDTSKISKGRSYFRLVKEEAEEMVEQLRKSGRTHGLWALPDATGSIGVVTINLPRLAIESGGDEGIFFDLLEERLEVAREVLLWWRKRYQRSLENGLMPITKAYLGHFNGHFSTFGVIGLPEAAVNIISEPDVWLDKSRGLEAIKIEKEIVSYIRKRAEEFEQEDGCLYNVEEVPGESASYRLARLDYEKYRDLIEAGKAYIPIWDGKPFYSNSIIPYYVDIPLARRVEWEGMVQQEFTGGVMSHLFFHEAMDPKALKKLVYNIATKTKVVYFSITPAMTVCADCKWNGVGVYDRCPKCGSSRVDIWSRIVGYYRPVRAWNEGKQAEFLSRVHYGKVKMRPADALRRKSL